MACIMMAGIAQSDKMQNELNRLASFSNWPDSSTISPILLAKSGLFYSGSSDETVCFSCNVHISGWKKYDDPREKHRNQSPHCSLVNNIDDRNKPLVNPSQSISHQESKKRIAEVPDSLNHLLQSATSRATSKGFLDDSETTLIDRENPDYDRLRSERERLDTFHDWPATSHARPETLAREGFFYTGIDDLVKCAFCRGCLKKWQPTDSPSSEHSKHYPACPFVRRLPVSNIEIETRSTDLKRIEDTHTWRSNPEGSPPTIAPTTLTRELDDIETRMDTPMARAVLGIGFSRDMVRTAIDRNLQETGNDFPNAESLLEAIFHLKDITASEEALGATAAGVSAQSHLIVPSSSTANDPNKTTSSYSESSRLNETNAASKPRIESLRRPFYSSRDSGISIWSSISGLSSSSLPAVSVDPISNSASSMCLVPSAVRSEASTILPSAQTPLRGQHIASAPETASMTNTQQEHDNNAPIRAKAKRRRKKKKASMASASNEDIHENNVDDKEEEEVEEKESKSSISLEDREAIKYLEENRQLREARTCKVCMDAEVNTVFLPCGHLVCCNNCAPQLRNCPICRTFIRGTVKTSLS